MAKDKNKSAARQAAEQQQAPKNEEQQQNITHKDIIRNPKLIRGLSQDSKVMLAYLTHDRYIKNPQMEYPVHVVEGANVMTDALMADAYVTEIVSGGGVVSMIIARDEKKYMAIANMLMAQGIKMPEFKALPAPTEEQLKQAGVALLPAESAVVTVKPEDVPEETKAAKKKEVELSKKQVDLDPTKIENEEQLKECLTYIFVRSAEALDVKVQKAIDFYNSYLTIKATKAENKEEELKKVKEIPRATLLATISKIVGPCPMMPKGLGYFLFGSVQQTGSIVPAFCLYRRSAVSTSKNKDVDDAFVADIVRILINWYGDGEVDKFTKLNNNNERQLKKLNEDKKANVKIIKATEAAVRFNNEQIEKVKSVLEIVNNPLFNIIDTINEHYNAEDMESAEYKLAHRIVRNVMDTYHPNVELSSVENDSMLNDAIQHIGIITNLFCDPLLRNINYSESNLTELVMKKAEEEKPAEGSKN